MYSIYIIENSETLGWYIGFTKNLKQRIAEHNSKKSPYTSKFSGKWKLIYCEGYLNKKDALGRERFLKSGSGRKFLKKQLTNYFINN